MENRAQQFKPGDFSLGQVHEWLGAFGRQGGTPDLLQKAIEDQELMRRVVDFWRAGGSVWSGWPPTFLNIQWMRAREIMGKNFLGLEEAIGYFGVSPNSEQWAELSVIRLSYEVLKQHKDTHILVAVPSLSIINTRSRVQGKELFYNQNWYEKEPSALEEGEWGWHLVQKTPVLDSLSKNWDEQIVLLRKEDEVPSARVMVYTIIGYFLATGERLFEKVHVRTSSVSSFGCRVDVGRFDSFGLHVRSGWGGRRHDNIGLASSRKFNP